MTIPDESPIDETKPMQEKYSIFVGTESGILKREYFHSYLYITIYGNYCILYFFKTIRILKII